MKPTRATCIRWSRSTREPCTSSTATASSTTCDWWSRRTCRRAHFGGDPDNFTYPRWSIDFSFLRAYVDDAPADTSAHYFRWRAQGALENDLVFVPGNPGNTNRQLTVTQLEVQRDVEYPMLLEQLEHGIAILEPFRDRSPGILTTLLSWENSYKAIGGMLDGLKDADLMRKKVDHEQHFRNEIAQDQELGKLYGDIWRQIDALTLRQREQLPKAAFYSPSYSGVIERGVAIAEALDETVGEEERKAARDKALNMEIRGNVLTRALLLDHFARAAEWLPADDPYLVAVAGKHRRKAATDWGAALVDLGQSKLADAAFVRELLEAEDAADRWQQSADPGIRAARVLWPLTRATDKNQEMLDGKFATQGTRLGRALFAVYGSDISPDATMTLRFSDGRVLGYDYNGTRAPWATTLYGLYGRGTAFANEYPFDIPKPWLDARDRLDLADRVCFASTNDIVGGNSGSCVVDRDLRIVGLIFDGNIESLANDFYYTQEVARAVSVHSDAIVAALEHVYGMKRVVEELRRGADR